MRRQNLVGLGALNGEIEAASYPQHLFSRVLQLL
jgi:hypothetical protein